MPHTCRSRYPPGSAQLGGKPTFAEAMVNGEVAPTAAIPGCSIDVERAQLAAFSHLLKSAGARCKSVIGSRNRMGQTGDFDANEGQIG